MEDNRSDLVIVEDRSAYALLRINRPEKRNAMSHAARRALAEALTTVRGHKVVVLTGTGASFCAGIDLKEAAAERAGGGGEAGAREWIDVLLAIRRHPAIFIAAVNGFALGGGSTLINVSDLAIAANEAEIGMPEMGFATYPGMAGPAMQIMMPRKRAAWMVLTARRIDGQTAERWGMVNLSVPLAELDREADALARHVAQFDAAALSESKIALETIPTRIGDFAGGFDYGRHVNAAIAARSAGQTEGLARFARGEANVTQGKRR
ncbi:MAG TPA: enoyl-CoA hydratase/isomerase family protein [Stellaceae bacterium]|nr:enoyl-CoA hydratase/isomerase family protein [Stellaceae bacterium]